MTKGKIAAQCGCVASSCSSSDASSSCPCPMLTTLPARRHATLACYKSLMQANPAVRPRPSTSSSARVLTSSSSPRAARSSLGAHRVRRLIPRPALRDHADVCTCFRSQAKIAVQCRSEEDLQLLQASAQSLGLCARSIQDACVHLPFFTRSALTDGSRGARSGRTQVDPGTTTVLGASLSRTVLSSPSPTSYSHFSSLRRYWSCACTRRQPGHQPPQAFVTRLPSPSLAIAPHILRLPQLVLARSAFSARSSSPAFAATRLLSSTPVRAPGLAGPDAATASSLSRRSTVLPPLTFDTTDHGSPPSRPAPRRLPLRVGPLAVVRPGRPRRGPCAVQRRPAPRCDFRLGPSQALSRRGRPRDGFQRRCCAGSAQVGGAARRRLERGRVDGRGRGEADWRREGAHDDDEEGQEAGTALGDEERCGCGGH